MPERDEFDDLFGDTPITVELGAYVLPDLHRVYKCSPGKTHRFYEVVRDAEVVFPDVRGLAEMVDGATTWNDETALRAIAADRWSRELESRARKNQPKAGSAAVNKTDRARLTFVKRLFFEAKKGDFVVIPAEGYDKEILFGEFLNDPGVLKTVEAQDGSHFGSYIGRPVQWRKKTIKRELNPKLIDALHSRVAVFPLIHERAEDVYREVLGNFIFRGKFVAEFRTAKDKFTAEDTAVVSTWLNGFDYLRHQMALDVDLELPAAMNFYRMGLEPVPDDGAAELRINIQSPGEIFVRSAGPFALALMAMFALTGCDAKAVVENGVTIKLKTIGDASDDCRIQVENTVNGIVRTMSYERLNDANCLGGRAASDAKVRVDASLISLPRTRK